MKILPFILLFILTGCFDKNAPGKNETFFCQINGKAFRPDKDTHPIGGIGVNPLRTYWYKDNKLLSIYATRYPENIILRFHYNNESQINGKYDLTNDINANIGSYTPNYDIQMSENILSVKGSLNITSATTKTISGTFEFEGIDKNGQKYIISKGQFNNVEF
jgi:hypothetical protein